MRKMIVPALALLALSLTVGCGGSETSIPTSVTPDQEKQLQEAQATVDAEERQHQASQ